MPGTLRAAVRGRRLSMMHGNRREARLSPRTAKVYLYGHDDLRVPSGVTGAGTIVPPPHPPPEFPRKFQERAKNENKRGGGDNRRTSWFHDPHIFPRRTPPGSVPNGFALCSLILGQRDGLRNSGAERPTPRRIPPPHARFSIGASIARCASTSRHQDGGRRTRDTDRTISARRGIARASRRWE